MKQLEVTYPLFFVGSINKPGPWLHPSGEGISLYTLDRQSGTIKQVVTFPEVENAIWLTRREGGMFVASERFYEFGEICSLDFDGKNRLYQKGLTQLSGGGAICHIALHPVKPVLFVSSFLGGISVHSINQRHEIGPTCQKIDYTGKGPHVMQDKSHPHQATVTPDGKYLFVCDLGSDKVWIHGINERNEGIHLSQGEGVDLEAGSGPRHLIFHPGLPVLYLLGQLNSQVYVYAYRAGTLRLLAKHHSLPEGFEGEAEGAAIKLHPSGKALYVSDRNSNTITVFSVGDKGDLIKVSSFSTMGKKPRDFLIAPTGDWMIVLNQDSDDLVPFRLDPLNGLSDGVAGEPIFSGCPVCGLFW